MAGIRKLRFIQLGKETTAGTEVNATAIWRGTGTIKDDREVVFPEEDVGYKVPTGRVYTPKVLATLELDETPATYEQILHLLEMGIEEDAPAQDGSGAGYIYAYPFATTTDSAAVQTKTVEGGDNTQEEQFLYGFCKSFTLSGVPGEALMMSGTIVGRQVATGTKTAGLTLPTVEEILFSKATLYIDVDTATAFGTTAKSSTLMGATLNVTTGWMEQFTGDGQIYFTFIKNTGPEVTLDLTFEHDSTAVAEIAAWRAGTRRLVRLKFTGSAFTAGTSFSAKTLFIDLAGVWESFDKIDERDGNDIVTGTLRGAYSPAKSTMGNIRVVTNLSAIP